MTVGSTATASLDIPILRKYELTNGNTLNLTWTEPHGFFYFHLNKGNLPQYMLGAYTSVHEAEKALKIYLSERETALGPPPPRPEIKFKPGYEKHSG